MVNLKNKKILLVGLGALGGGEATAEFLFKNGARLTITDLKPAENFEDAVKRLKKKFPKQKITFVFGVHQKKDFLENDIIIFNQSVPASSFWVKFARQNKKQIETDLTLFLKILKSVKPAIKYIAVTGTRGKTTITTWIHHFLKPAFIGGNIPGLSPLAILPKILKSKKNLPIVLEIPSAQLEYFNYVKGNLPAPKVAVITNLYVDHLNRHGSMKNYGLAKVKIFQDQTKDDYLILNSDQDNSLFLSQKPKSRIILVSGDNLLTALAAAYFYRCHPRASGDSWVLLSPRKRGSRTTALDSRLRGNDKTIRGLIKKISSLPAIKFRQEIIFQNKKWMIINDSAATSPDGTIMALEKFGKISQKSGRKLFLIAGGTDKKLEFKELAIKIKKYIKIENLFLLNGSATERLIQELQKELSGQKINLFENLKDILSVIGAREKSGIILFSPAAASFEKFQNEFDRGEKFNKLVKNLWKI